MDAISGLQMPPGLASGLEGLKLEQAGAPKIAAGELANLGSLSFAQAGQGSSGRAFSEFLGDIVRDVNAKQASAGQAVEGVLSGENVPLHQAMIAVEEASVSFQLMVEVRNKLLESYQELMRMQI